MNEQKLNHENKNLKTKIDDFFYSQKKYRGLYSPNRAVLFSLVLLFFISLFSATNIVQFSTEIKNNYVQKIYIALSQPLVDFSKKLKTDELFLNIRKNFLTASNLSEDFNWDEFYYQKESDLMVARQPKIQGKRKLESKENQKILPIQNKNLEIINNSTHKITQTNNNTKDNLLLVVPYEYNKNKPLKILFAGDSEMECFSNGFLRIVGGKSAFKIISYAVPSSGFIRTDYYNWPAKFKSIFAEAEQSEEPYDCVVLLLGMNDSQNFFDGNGNLFKTGTEEWKKAYIGKIKAYFDVLQPHVKKIYWLGLPTVKSKTMNQEVKFIEECQIEASKQLNVEGKIEKISIQKIAPGIGAPYTEIIQTPDGNRIKLMRADGTHLTISGGEFMMKQIMKKFYIDFDIEPRK